VNLRDHYAKNATHTVRDNDGLEPRTLTLELIGRDRAPYVNAYDAAGKTQFLLHVPSASPEQRAALAGFARGILEALGAPAEISPPTPAEAAGFVVGARVEYVGSYTPDRGETGVVDDRVISQYGPAPRVGVTWDDPAQGRSGESISDLKLIEPAPEPVTPSTIESRREALDLAIAARVDNPVYYAEQIDAYLRGEK